MHDICENPERFDSWAGMALARMSRLEQKLNSVSTIIYMNIVGSTICIIIKSNMDH